MLLAQERIHAKNMAFYVPIGRFGTQDIVVKCAAAIFFRRVD